MKLHATIDDYQTDIRIRDEGARVIAEIDGRQYDLNVHEKDVGEYLIIADGQVFDCRVATRPESGIAVDVTLGSANYSVTLTDPKRLRGATDAGAHDDEAARIIAPMPGKIVRVLVSAGEQVDAGAGIVVVEAMKMQNEMKSPKAGTVSSLNVRVGETVNAGQVLAVIE
jgi:biotin carboxyl carrier protein